MSTGGRLRQRCQNRRRPRKNQKNLNSILNCSRRFLKLNMKCLLSCTSHKSRSILDFLTRFTTTHYQKVKPLWVAMLRQLTKTRMISKFEKKDRHLKSLSIKKQSNQSPLSQCYHRTQVHEAVTSIQRIILEQYTLQRELKIHVT